jgi:hypothetical protein
MLLSGCGCVTRIALRAHSIVVDNCNVIILFSIDCNIRPAAAAGVVPAGLDHSMHHFSQRCTCSSTWFERRRLKLVFCCAVFPNGIKNLLASDPPFLMDRLLHRCANSSRKSCSETPGRFAIRRAIHVVLSFAPSDLRMYLIFLGNKAYEVSSCDLPIISLRRDFISFLYRKAGWDFQHQPIVTPSSTPS